MSSQEDEGLEDLDAGQREKVQELLEKDAVADVTRPVPGNGS